MKNQAKFNELIPQETNMLKRLTSFVKSKDLSTEPPKHKIKFAQSIIHGITGGKTTNNKTFPKKMLILPLAITIILSAFINLLQQT